MDTTTAIRKTMRPATRHLRLATAPPTERAVSRVRDERRRLEARRDSGRFDYLRRGHD